MLRVLPSLLGLLLLPLSAVSAEMDLPTTIDAGVPSPEAPAYPGKSLPVGSGASAGATKGISFSRTGNFGTLDLTNRNIASAFYQSVFAFSEGTAMEWSGNASTCDAGDTSAAYKDAILTRINWYRAMAGVPDDITFDVGPGSYSDKAQDAALIMGLEEALSHNPPSNWACYTSSGGEAAGKSNLSLGSNGWDAIDGQMIDNGSNNAAAGHRRWILYPQTRLMGSGDIPDGAGSYRKANSLWVFDSHYLDDRPATREAFVAWPPPGFVPYQVVPPRWSFSYAAADFSAATVSITQAGQPVSVQLETVNPGAGESTLVWVTAGLNPAIYNQAWPALQGEARYDVTVKNVSIGGSLTDFSYQVTIFDPGQLGTPALQVTGPTQIDLRGAAFANDTLGFGDGYQLREIAINPYQGDEGAEDGGVNIIDGTDSSYALLSTQTSASGSFSFHLAHPVSTTQSVEFTRLFVLGSSSTLRFSSRLSWATPDQTARLQISTDEGVSWQDLYSQSGTTSAGDTSFTPHTIPLSGYANRVVRLRAVYEVKGSYYYDTGSSSSPVGFYIDDIALTDARERGAVTLTPLDSSGSFSYTPTVAGEYGLQVQAVPWSGFPGLDWGTIHLVSVDPGGGCDGDIVTLSSSLQTGQSVTCTATTSITTSGSVVVPTGATLILKAPVTHLNPGFHAAAGASFSARP